ncbi:MAG: cupin domain-containing protein [Candidatus Thorarchaeota archaeon]
MYLTKDTASDAYSIYDKPGMKGVRRRHLLNPDNSSKNFAMRMYTIESGGHTTYDVHLHEHGVYMFSGEATVRIGEQELLLQVGDVLHISRNEPHQFFNHGKELVKFLCVRDFTSA